MAHKFAFAGFRHPHILSLLRSVEAHPRCEITAAWEADPETRQILRSEGTSEITHDDFEDLLEPGVCTIVAIGDVYGRRGALAIAALKAGRHVISDKPICTDLAELEEIERLAREKRLSVGCQLDLVENGAVRGLRAIVAERILGRLCTVTIAAQHPLRYGKRAAWYFEGGAHGGTINDIGVHVFHLLPWLTGARWKTLLSARHWNAKAEAAPHFKDCAQFHGVLENEVSCFADVSYLAPNQLGFDLPQYWRITMHGTQGMAEAGFNDREIFVVTDDDKAGRRVPVPADPPRGALQDFLDEINGSPSSEGLTTERVLTASRLALEAQNTAIQSA